MNRIALYIRLSRMDDDLDEEFEESNSVQNQRLLLNEYLDRQEEFTGYERIEYVDDGYSGTTQDRPALKRMLEDVRGNQINTIITKDLSRAGRNYVDVGNLIEYIFPFLGVRFISVADGYDSRNDNGTTPGLEIAFRNMLHDSYAKDTSIKIKASKQRLMKEGIFAGNRPPYGYRLDMNLPGRVAVDPEKAEHVKKIFELTVAGKSRREVTRYLNDHEIPPMGSATMNGKPIWIERSIRDMIKNEFYIGVYIANKVSKVRPCSKQMVHNPPEKQIVWKNHHEAIISVELFEQANAMIKKTKPHSMPNQDPYPLKSLLYCGFCGRRLWRKGGKRNTYFYCCNYQALKACDQNGCLCEKKLEEVILEELCEHVKQKAAEIRKKKGEQVTLSPKQMGKELKNLEKKITDARQDGRGIYEEYADGKIRAEAYRTRMEVIKKQRDILESERSAILKQMEEIHNRDDSREQVLLTAEEQLKKERVLTPDLARNLIESIQIRGMENLEIRWKDA